MTEPPYFWKQWQEQIEQHFAEKTRLIAEFLAEIEQHVENEQLTQVKLKEKDKKYLKDTSELQRKLEVLEQSRAQLEHHLEEGRAEHEIIVEEKKALLKITNEQLQYHSKSKVRETEQVIHPNKAFNQQKTKYWKNEIHRQNEEHYLQTGLLLNEMEPIPEGMTQDTFTGKIEVIKEPFSEYTYMNTVLCVHCVLFTQTSQVLKY